MRALKHFTRKFEATPSARTYLRDAMEYLEAAVLSIPGYRGAAHDHPESLGMRDDIVWATPPKAPVPHFNSKAARGR